MSAPMPADEHRAHRDRLTLGPLTGVRVVELGQGVAGPYAGAMLADLGAEVIKIEHPVRGDSMRTMGPMVDGVGLWWTVAGRNKKSVTLDLKHPEAPDIVLGIVAKSDVVIENFRPGVLERLQLGWDRLTAANPHIVLVRVSGFGQTGPRSPERGLGKIAEAYSGATNLTGDADRPPVHPGYSLADLVTGLTAAFGALAALRARDAGGEGQIVDLALYEPMLRMIEWQLPLAAKAGFNATRSGVTFPVDGAFVTGIWPTLEGQHVVVSAATSETIDRVARLLISEGELDAAEWDSGALSHDAVAVAVERWIKKTPVEHVLERFEQAKAVAGLVYDPQAILDDPHLRERGSIVDVDHPVLGAVPMPSVVPRMVATPGAVRWPGPDLGEHTAEVLVDLLRYDAARVESLRVAGVTSPR